jgi:hypothetical protein
MEGHYNNNSQDGHPAAPGMMGAGYQDYPDNNNGNKHLYNSVIGMYNDGNEYDDEVDGGDEDKNDGMNALVR